MSPPVFPPRELLDLGTSDAKKVHAAHSQHRLGQTGQWGLVILEDRTGQRSAGKHVLFFPHAYEWTRWFGCLVAIVESVSRRALQLAI